MKRPLSRGAQNRLNRNRFKKRTGKPGKSFMERDQKGIGEGSITVLLVKF